MDQVKFGRVSSCDAAAFFRPRAERGNEETVWVLFSSSPSLFDDLFPRRLALIFAKEAAVPFGCASVPSVTADSHQCDADQQPPCERIKIARDVVQKVLEYRLSFVLFCFCLFV